MKLDNIELAKRLMDERAALILSHDAVNENTSGHQYLGITLQGRYQDEDFIAAVKPAVMSELRRRMNLIESKLKQLGVEIP